MKKILLITENLGSGGAERQITGLAVMLTKAGYPCRLITYVENQFYEPYLRENGVDYELVKELWNKKTRVFKTIKYINNYKPDVVISYLPSVNMTMCLSKTFIKAKLIVSERNNNICVTFKDRILFNLYRFADAIVPNSKCQGLFISKHFPFLSEKIHPIINFVDVDRFSPAEDKPYNEKPRIITVARYTQQKNVLKYLKVIRKAKDLNLNVHFDWYGSTTFNKSYFECIIKEIDTLHISDYMTVHGPKSTIEEEYKMSDIFCLPSLFEGYPNVIAEAMSCGLPIVCSNRFENPYIVKEGINGFLFDPENEDDMLSAIQKALSLTVNQRLSMGQRNRSLCIERNTAEVFVSSYIDLISNI